MWRPLQLSCRNSLQDFRQEELTSRRGPVHEQLDDEKRRRENMLNVKQQLGQQVVLKSKEAGTRRHYTFYINFIPIKKYNDMNWIRNQNNKYGQIHFARSSACMSWFLISIMHPVDMELFKDLKFTTFNNM